MTLYTSAHPSLAGIPLSHPTRSPRPSLDSSVQQQSIPARPILFGWMFDHGDTSSSSRNSRHHQRSVSESGIRPCLLSAESASAFRSQHQHKPYCFPATEAEAATRVPRICYRPVLSSDDDADQSYAKGTGFSGPRRRTTRRRVGRIAYVESGYHSEGEVWTLRQFLEVEETDERVAETRLEQGKAVGGDDPVNTDDGTTDAGPAPISSKRMSLPASAFRRRSLKPPSSSVSTTATPYVCFPPSDDSFSLSYFCE